MSYLVKNKRRRYRGNRVAMGGIADFFNSLADEIWKSDPSNAVKTETNACLAEAHAQTAQLDAKTSDLSKNWRPSGFYSAQQVQQLVNATLDVLHRAQVALGTVIADDTLGDTASLRGTWSSTVQRKVDAARPYVDAAQAASTAGTAAVNAPGLKDWVVKSMQESSNAMDAAYVVACQRPWWAGVFRAFATAFNALWSLAKAIVGVAIDVGTAVVKVASALPDIANVLMWGGLAVGAYFLYTQFRGGGRRELVSLL